MTGPADGEFPPEVRAARSIADRIEKATAEAGRPAGSVRLLVVTKYVPVERIAPVLADGFTTRGENRVQEIIAKQADLAESAGRNELHMLGHLQQNKVNQLLTTDVSCLQSLDSAGLAQRLQTRLTELDRTLEVYLQVNVSGEDTKSGVTVHEAPALLSAVAECDRLVVRGLMTIGLNSPDQELVGAGFRRLAELAERLRADHPTTDLTMLSMGMSGDFEAAIAAGSTLVRVGSAIFGARPSA